MLPALRWHHCTPHAACAALASPHTSCCLRCAGTTAHQVWNVSKDSPCSGRDRDRSWCVHFPRRNVLQHGHRVEHLLLLRDHAKNAAVGRVRLLRVNLLGSRVPLGAPQSQHVTSIVEDLALLIASDLVSHNFHLGCALEPARTIIVENWAISLFFNPRQRTLPCEGTNARSRRRGVLTTAQERKSPTTGELITQSSFFL
jgi:hypothetical protein